MNKEYQAAVAFLQLKIAYERLVKATQQLPDLDVSDCYPFYILDFEDIQPAVSQWCNVHATALMKHLPAQVDNPQCVGCTYFRQGIAKNGLCVGAHLQSCQVYPLIPYDRLQVTPFLKLHGCDITLDTPDDVAHLLYIRKVEELYERKQTMQSGSGDRPPQFIADAKTGCAEINAASNSSALQYEGSAEPGSRTANAGEAEYQAYKNNILDPRD